MSNLILALLLATATEPGVSLNLNPAEQAAITKAHDQIASKLAPSAKLKLRRVSHSLVSTHNAGDAARLGVTSAFPDVNFSEGDINALTLFVLSEASSSASEDVRAINDRLARINERKTVLRQTMDSTQSKDMVKNKLDSLSEMGQMESLRLQMAMDRLSKFMQTLSNLLKKQSDTASAIVQNLK
jgi:hypothetical protein